MTTPAFATGSRVYGVPREDSDTDLVVLILEDRTLELLAAIADPPDKTKDSGADERPSFRFGRLNIIVVRTIQEWVVWATGTNDLIARAPVTRDEAKTYLIGLEAADAPL